MCNGGLKHQRSSNSAEAGCNFMCHDDHGDHDDDGHDDHDQDNLRLIQGIGIWRHSGNLNEAE